MKVFLLYSTVFGDESLLHGVYFSFDLACKAADLLQKMLDKSESSDFSVYIREHEVIDEVD